VLIIWKLYKVWLVMVGLAGRGFRAHTKRMLCATAGALQAWRPGDGGAAAESSCRLPGEGTAGLAPDIFWRPGL